MTNTSGAGTAQDFDEPFDVINADGSPTGRVKARGLIHRDGDWHRALHVWVAGIDAEGVPFLTFQRRSPYKDTWPDRFDVTVGGHYRAGETLVESLREVEEEIGIVPDRQRLRPLGVRVWANEGEPEILDRELQDVFLLQDDRPLEAYRPNPAELTALVRFPIETLLPFLAGEVMEVHGESLAPGAECVEPVIAHADDFIPTIDGYFLRVAIAAQNALRGDIRVIV